MVVTCNLLGLPAAVVPVSVVDGLPQAVQIIGPRYQEDACLDAAETIEAALGCITPIDPIE
jgi:amidase